MQVELKEGRTEVREIIEKEDNYLEAPMGAGVAENKKRGQDLGGEIDMKVCALHTKAKKLTDPTMILDLKAG